MFLFVQALNRWSMGCQKMSGWILFVKWNPTQQRFSSSGPSTTLQNLSGNKTTLEVVFEENINSKLSFCAYLFLFCWLLWYRVSHRNTGCIILWRLKEFKHWADTNTSLIHTKLQICINSDNFLIELWIKVLFLLKCAINLHSSTQACHYLIPQSRKIIAIILNGTVA